MKVITLLALIAFSNGTKLDRIYLPPNAKASAGSADILEAPVPNVVVVSNAERPIPEAEEVVRVGNIGQGFVQSPNLVEYKEVKYPVPRYQIVEQIPERAQAALERNAAVLRQDFKNDGETYAYAYETENGIYGEENGVAIDGVRANGAFSYIGDDGVQYSMSYTADENGFQPKGDHLPVPPPIPEEILRSLEQNARDEAAGIFDDGSYDEHKYGSTDGQGLGIINVAEKYYNVVPTISSYLANNKDTVIVSTSDYVSKFQNSGYKSPLFIDQKNNLVPALNNLVQDVTPSTVNKAYLPPAEVVLEDRSSESNEKPLFGSKIRQPNFNAKSGYKY